MRFSWTRPKFTGEALPDFLKLGSLIARAEARNPKRPLKSLAKQVQYLRDFSKAHPYAETSARELAATIDHQSTRWNSVREDGSPLDLETFTYSEEILPEAKKPLDDLLKFINKLCASFGEDLSGSKPNKRDGSLVGYILHFFTSLVKESKSIFLRSKITKSLLEMPNAASLCTNGTDHRSLIEASKAVKAFEARPLSVNFLDLIRSWRIESQVIDLYDKLRERKDLSSLRKEWIDLKKRLSNKRSNILVNSHGINFIYYCALEALFHPQALIQLENLRAELITSKALPSV